MTNVQLYLSIGVQLVFNSVLIGMLLMYMDRRFDAVNQRFDDMRGLWLAELHRVEQVLDARLTHLEKELDK